jgi:hypothetical protein
LFFYFFLGAVVEKYAGASRLVSLSAPHRSAMAAISKIVPPASNFLVISSAEAWHTDRVSEWFPALTSQRSILTVQGSEWLGQGVYAQRISQYESLKACLSRGQACFSGWLADHQGEYEYLYLEKGLIEKGRIDLAAISSSHRVIYDNEEVLVIERTAARGRVSRH